MRLNNLILFFLISFNLHSKTVHWLDSLTQRIINRKHISHFTINFRKNRPSIDIVISDRFPYNYKSPSYVYYILFENEKQAVDFSFKLDKHLNSGYNIKIELQGSEIIKYEFL